MSSFFAFGLVTHKATSRDKGDQRLGNGENWTGAGGKARRGTGASQLLRLLRAWPLFLLAFPLARQRGCGLLLCMPARDFRRGGRLPNPGPATARDDPLAIRGEGHREDLTAVVECEQLLAGGRLPDLGHRVAERDNPLAIRGKGSPDGRQGPALPVPCEGKQFLAARRVPDPGRRIKTAGDNPLAVRRKGRGHDETEVAFECEQFLAAARLPNPGHFPTGGDNPLAIRRKGRGIDGARVPFEGEQFHAAGRLPNPGRLVGTRGNDPLAIRGKGHGIEGTAVSFEGEQFLAAGRLPDPGRL